MAVGQTGASGRLVGMTVAMEISASVAIGNVTAPRLRWAAEIAVARVWRSPSALVGSLGLSSSAVGSNMEEFLLSEQIWKSRV